MQVNCMQGTGLFWVDDDDDHDDDHDDDDDDDDHGDHGGNHDAYNDGGLGGSMEWVNGTTLCSTLGLKRSAVSRSQKQGPSLSARPERWTCSSAIASTPAAPEQVVLLQYQTASLKWDFSCSEVG